jgi:hypothetical protein
MQGLTRISVAVVCALGVTAAIAQTVQPRTQGATQARPPIQTAQAPAGGVATGASTATAATTATAGAVAAGTATFVTFGAVAVGSAAADSGSSGATVTHTP